jgi:hypothetical protein
MSAPLGEARLRLGEASKLVERIARERPDLVELAEVASFAVRIDPVLLRRLRLRFFPRSAASLEADLWHSELVHVRSPDGFTLTPWVAAALRERLGERHRERYDGAWEVTGASHRMLPETLRVEEELNYLERARKPGSRKRATAILQQAIATVIGSRDTWIAAWGAGAASRASAGVDLGEERRLLEVASSTRLGTATPALKRGDDWLSWAAGEGVERLPYRVRMGTNWLELRPADDVAENESAEEAYEAAQQPSSAMTVMLPRTSPMVVKVSWSMTGEATRLRKPRRRDETPVVDPHEQRTLEPEPNVADSVRTLSVELRAVGPTIVRIGSTTVVLRTLLGDEYAIAPRPGREGWTIPSPLPNQIGYERELDEVTARLRRSDGAPVIVAGPAGAGRRQFALRAAFAVRESFERSFLIRLREKSWTARTLLSAVLRRLGGDRRGSVALAVEELTRRTGESSTLIVLDVGGAAAPVEALRVGRGSALLVVRRGRGAPSNSNIGLGTDIWIGGLDPEAAIGLFKRWARRSVSPSLVHSIVEACDFLPVPIIEVASLAATMREEELERLPALIAGAVRLAAIPHPFDPAAARAVLDESAPDENAYETRAS